MSAREELLCQARKVLWQAWSQSSEEIGSEAARTLMGLGMLVPQGGAAELERLRARVAELEAAAAALALPQHRDRHGDIWEERADGKYLQNVQLAHAETPHENGWLEAAETIRRDFGPMHEVPVSEAVAKLRALLAPQQPVEDPHDSPLHHDYAEPRDLPARADLPESLR